MLLRFTKLLMSFVSFVNLFQSLQRLLQLFILLMFALVVW